MTIIEAAFSGKPFRRKSWHDFLTLQKCPCATSPRPHAPGGCPDPAYMFPEYVDPKLTFEDLAASDWTTEPLASRGGEA